MKSTELVTHEVVMGHAPPHAKVFGIAPRMQGTNRHHKALAVGGGHVGGSPELSERKLAGVVNQGGIGGCQRLDADIVLRDPG